MHISNNAFEKRISYFRYECSISLTDLGWRFSGQFHQSFDSSEESNEWYVSIGRSVGNRIVIQ
jgi:hypothetical protein